MSITTTTSHRVDLGALFRQLRERAGVTREQAADLLGCTTSKIGDLELARSKMKPAEAEALLVRYEVPDEQRKQIMAHVRRQPGRRPYGANGYLAPPQLRRIAELEAQAVAAWYYSGDVIPPLLQVRSYAQALIASTEPHLGRAADLANFQLTRQHVLHHPDGRPPLRYRCLLGEAVLHTKIGSEPTMLEQLTHVRDLAVRLPNLELHLVPFALGSHPLLGFSATLYHLRKPAPPQLISEAPRHRFTQLRGEPVQHMRAAFDQLATTALSRQETVEHLTKHLSLTNTAGQLQRRP